MRWPWIIVMTALAVATGWLLQRLDEDSLGITPQERHEPDYYMERFAKMSMDAEGRPDNKLAAEFMVHYPDDDSTELVRPKIEIYNGAERPWIVVAERGWVSANNEVILLYGPVEIWRNDSAGNRGLEVLTRDLRILTDEDYAESDNPTTVRSRTSTTEALGMRARFGVGRLELLNAVRGHHEVNQDS